MWMLRQQITIGVIVVSCLLVVGSVGVGANWFLTTPQEKGGSATPAQSPVVAAEVDPRSLEGTWLEVKRDEVTNEISSVSRLIFNKGMYKMIYYSQIEPEAKKGSIDFSPNPYPNYRYQVLETDPPRIEFQGAILTQHPAGFIEVEKQKHTVLYSIENGKLYLGFYYSLDGSGSVSIPPSATLKNSLPKDAKVRFELHTYLRDFPTFTNGKLNPPSMKHPAFQDTPVLQPPAGAKQFDVDVSDYDELVKQTELLAKLTHEAHHAGRLPLEARIRTEIGALKAKIEHPKTTQTDKNRYVLECMQKLESIKQNVDVRFRAGTIPQMEMMEGQIAILRARIEFREYLKNLHLPQR